jgi:hypothetical protein
MSCIQHLQALKIIQIIKEVTAKLVINTKIRFYSLHQLVHIELLLTINSYLQLVSLRQPRQGSETP